MKNHLACRARLHTQNGTVLRQINEHTHDSSPALVGVRKTVTSLKRKAISDIEQTPATLRRNMTENLTQPEIVQLPTKDALRHVVERVRNDVNEAPAQPQSRENIFLPLWCSKKH